MTIFEGLPGSGKSMRMIELINAARAAGQQTLTFACSDLPGALQRYGNGRHLLTCRIAGITCELDHLVSSPEAGRILDQAPSGTIAAFEEAHSFMPAIAGHWKAAARRGVDVLICLPSPAQKAQLQSFPRRETTFIVPCQHCEKADAARHVIPPGKDLALSICDNCYETLAAEIRSELLNHVHRSRANPSQTILNRPEGLARLAGESDGSWGRVENMELVIRESLDLEDAVRQCVPEHARVLVVSKGDDWLVKLDGRCGVHFPNTGTGTFGGYHPADSRQAIALLENERRNGADFIVFPARTSWWLNFYEGLRQYLEQHDKRIWHDATCVIYQLAAPPVH